uniref:DUF148 domain-containing protein n=1 Tax=Parastrongyloides trichosuri TaxID=131310 RepID=A0A0N4Z922_PARTI
MRIFYLFIFITLGESNVELDSNDVQNFQVYKKAINEKYVKKLVDEAIERLKERYNQETLGYKLALREYQRNLKKEQIKVIDKYKEKSSKHEEKLRKKLNKLNNETFGNDHFVEFPSDMNHELRTKKYKSLEHLLKEKEQLVIDEKNVSMTNKKILTNDVIKKSKLKLKRIKSKW